MDKTERAPRAKTTGNTIEEVRTSTITGTLSKINDKGLFVTSTNKSPRNPPNSSTYSAKFFFFFLRYFL